MIPWMLLFVTVATAQELLSEPTDFLCPEDDPNAAFPHETFCDKFYNCQSGIASLVTCEDGLGFDKLRRYHAGKCDDFSNIDCGNRTELQEAKPSVDGVCPRQHGRFTHPDPAICNSYVVCKQGRYVVKDCSNGLYFDPIESQCTWPQIANRQNCQRKKKKAADGWTCPDVDVGSQDETQGAVDPNPRYAHPKLCDKFYVCIGNIDPRLNACPYGLAYDEGLKKCDDYKTVSGCETWYDEDAPADQERVHSPVNASPVNEKDVTGTPKFECPAVTIEETGGNPHPTYPHPTDCTKFYVCIERKTPRKNTCGAGLVFNLETLLCDNPKNVPDCADWFDV